jgi:hypothetical protein
VIEANPAYTGEAQWSGGAYVQFAAGGALSWTIPAAAQPRRLQAIINRVPGPAGVSVFATSDTSLDDVRYGGGGRQGISPTPGALLPVTAIRLLASVGSLRRRSPPFMIGEPPIRLTEGRDLGRRLVRRREDYGTTM